MQFSKALPLLFDQLKRNQIDFALVGGLALYTLGTSRSTFDADFMITLNQADQVKKIMEKLGYESIHETKDVANYKSRDPEMGQVDFLFAHRKYAMAMMQRAQETSLLRMAVKVLCPEDLIGLKVQSSSNDPSRSHKDGADIDEIATKYGKTMDWKRIEEYYTLFKRLPEYRALKKRAL